MSLLEKRALCLFTLLIFSLLLVLQEIRGDEIIKKNGLVIQGTIIEEKPDYVIVDIGLSSLRVNRAEIAEIKKTENISAEEIEGDVAYNEGDFLNALRLYKSALETGKNTEQVREKIKTVESDIEKRVGEEIGGEIKKSRELIQKKQFKIAEDVINDAIGKVNDELLLEKLKEELAYISLHKAEAYIDAMNYKEAEAEYRQALKTAPEYYQAHLGLAELLVKDPSLIGQAIDEYLATLKFGEIALTTAQKNQIYFKLAELYFSKKNFLEAINYYRRVLETDETELRRRSELKLVEAYIKLAREISMTKPQEGLILLGSAIELDAKNIEARLLLAEIYKKLPSLDQAIAQYEEIIKIAPNTPDVHYQLALSYLEKGWFDLANQELRKELSINPQHYNALCQLGESFIEAGEAEKALPYFQNAKETMPEKYRAYLGFGIASWKLGRIAAAKENFQQVLAMNPTHEEALFYMGSIYMVEKNYTGAESLFQSVIELLQKRPRLSKAELSLLAKAHIRSGEVELALERPRTANEHFQKSLTYKPESAEAYYGLGQGHALLKRYRAAENYYMEAIKNEPQNPKYYLGLGILYHSFLKELDKAIENYRKYILLCGPDKITVNKWIMEIGGQPVSITECK